MADDRRKQQAWRSGSVKPAFVEPGKKSRGGGKRFAVIALILIVVGIVVGLLVYLRPPPEPIFLGVAVTQYANRSYPPNPWAQQDGDKLREHFKSDSAQAVQAQEKKGLLDVLTQLADRTGQSADKGRPVIVHLSAHAIVRDGKVFLLPGRAEPDQRSTWLPIEDVLAALRRGSGPRLLLLDLAGAIADAHTGMLADNVADVLSDELTRTEQAGNLPFLVLTACAKGEVAHASAELQRSVFGFFLEQGLLGHADGWNPAHEADGRVSARELAEYARVQVSNWAVHERLTSQTPTLFGQGKDFVLISPKQPFPPIQIPDPSANYLEWLQKGWQERDGWISEGAFRQVPRTFRELESILLQSEERWLAGEVEEVIKSELAGKLADLVRQKNELALKTFPPRSIAELRHSGIKDEKAVSTAIRPLLERIQAKIALKPEDFKPLQEKPPEQAPFGAVASLTFSAILELADPTQEQLKEFDSLLKSFAPPPRFIELATLRLLVDLDARTQERWNDKALAGARRLVLDCSRAAEEAAVMDPRCLPWLKDSLSAADANHREGLIQLTTGDADARVQGLQKLKDAAERFEQVSQIARVLGQGFQLRDEIRVFLPAFERALSRRGADSADEKLWADLVNQASRLQQLLNPKHPDISVRDEINSITDQLRFNLDRRAKSQFQTTEADKQIRRSSADGGPTASDLRRLMDVTIWSVADRVKLYNAARDVGQSSTKSAIDQAAAMKPGAAIGSTAPRPVATAGWRAQHAIDMLRLDGITNTKPLADGLERFLRTGTVADEETLGDAIRSAWAVSLPDQYRKLADAAAREQAGAVLLPVDLGSLPEGIERTIVEPTPDLRRQQLREYWSWLAASRYRATAEAMLKYRERAELTAWANRLEDAARELQSRSP